VRIKTFCRNPTALETSNRIKTFLCNDMHAYKTNKRFNVFIFRHFPSIGNAIIKLDIFIKRESFTEMMSAMLVSRSYTCPSRD
jgi:hypothetical protein